MHRTRLSLYYLAGYLTFAGLALLLVPTFALQLLFSNGEYGEVFPRLAGMLLLGLAILITQIIRHRIEVLYPTTVIARVLISLTLIAIYVETADPFFLVILAIVVFGIALTTWSYLTDRRDLG